VAFFQAGKSSEAGSPGYAILSSMFPIVFLLAGVSVFAQQADLVVENAVIYTVDPANRRLRRWQ
jgi:hypothetical protein